MEPQSELWWPLLRPTERRRVAIACTWPRMARRQAIQDAFGVSRATAKRDITAVRKVIRGNHGIRNGK